MTGHDLLILAIKAVNGGIFVVAFAVIAQALKPKRFAGLFSAAPSVAIANLLVAVLDKGHGEGSANADGMLIGAVAMTFACLAGILLLRRTTAIRGSAALCLAWAVAAAALFAMVTG